MPLVETASRLQSLGLLWSAVLVVVKVTLILGIARLLVAALPRASAATKHLLLVVAICSAIALPVFELVLPAWNVGVFRAPASGSVKTIGATGDEDDAPPTAIGTAITVAKAAGVVPQAKIDAVSRNIDLVKQSWQGFLLLAVASVAFVFLARTLIRRPASATQLAGDVAAALFWFHPLMWSTRRRAAAERDRASAERFSPTGLATATMVALVLIVPLSSLRLVAAPQPASSSIDVYADKDPAEKSDTVVLDRLLDTTDILIARYEDLTSNRMPESGKGWYQHGMKLHNNGDYGEAIAAFKQSVAHGYRVDDAKYNIACAYAQMNDAANSVKWLKDAIGAGYDDYHHIESDSDFDPIRSDPSFRAALTSRQEKNEGDDTLRQYATLRGLPDADGSEWFSVGFDLLPAGRYDESIDAFNHALAKRYKPATSLYNIACGYARKGDTTRALEYLGKALNEGFDSPDKFEDDHDLDNLRDDPRFTAMKKMAEDLRLRRTNVLETIFNGHDWSAQLDEFRAMTRKYPGSGRSWFNLGYAALQAKRNDESIAAFQRALAMNYRTAATMYDMACAYARSGRNDAAIEWLEKASAAGFELKSYIDSDADLMQLRHDPRFRELRREVLAR